MQLAQHTRPTVPETRSRPHAPPGSLPLARGGGRGTRGPREKRPVPPGLFPAGGMNGLDGGPRRLRAAGRVGSFGVISLIATAAPLAPSAPSPPPAPSPPLPTVICWTV